MEDLQGGISAAAGSAYVPLLGLPLPSSWQVAEINVVPFSTTLVSAIAQGRSKQWGAGNASQALRCFSLELFSKRSNACGLPSLCAGETFLSCPGGWSAAARFSKTCRKPSRRGRESVRELD